MTNNFKTRLKLLKESINHIKVLQANSMSIDRELLKEVSNQMKICKELYKVEKFNFYNSKL